MPLLLKGDCLEVMKDLSANSIDCFICDLPYGCLAKGYESPGMNPNVKKKMGNRTEATCNWDVAIDLDAFWTQVKRLTKDEHTPVLMFCTTKFGNDLINSNPKWFRYDLVWDKGIGVSFLSANKMPMRSHEMIYVFSKAGAYYNRIDISGDFPAWKSSDKGSVCRQYTQIRTAGQGEAGKRCALSVIRNPKSSKVGGHPTEKPHALYEWLIKRYCPPGGTILDPTAGSFNSIWVATEMGLNAIGIEKNDKFFEKAQKRFNQETNEIVECSV